MKKHILSMLACFVMSHSIAQSDRFIEPIRVHAITIELAPFVYETATCATFIPEIRATMMQRLHETPPKALGAAEARIFFERREIKDSLKYILSLKPEDEDYKSIKKPTKEECLGLKLTQPTQADIDQWRIKWEADILRTPAMHKRCLEMFPNRPLSLKPFNKEADEVRFGASAEGRKASAEFLLNPPADSLAVVDKQVLEYDSRSWGAICGPM